MALDENYLICIFMNVYKNNENLEKRGKNMVTAMFWMGYKIYLASLKSILMAASGQRDTIMP